LLASIGVACDIVAPSLTPVRPGDRVKTDRRDARKLVRLYRAGELTFVCPPSPEQEGLRDLVRCRDDLRPARTAARHRVGKQLLRYGRVYREGKKSWTLQHRAWVRRQRLDEPLAQAALEHMLCHLDAIDAQIAAVDHQLDEIARTEPWCDPVRWLCCFRGISTLTALGLLAEIGGSAHYRCSCSPGCGRLRSGSRSAARAIASASIGSDFPRVLPARRSGTVSFGGTRTTSSPTPSSCRSSQRVSWRQSSTAHTRSASSADAHPSNSSLPTGIVFSRNGRPASSTATAVTDCLCTSSPITII
jgi:hypothetical protein